MVLRAVMQMRRKMIKKMMDLELLNPSKRKGMLYTGSGYPIIQKVFSIVKVMIDILLYT